MRELFPEVSRWLESTYGTQAELVLGDLIILSCQGFDKGDPLACLFFAVVLYPIIKRIAEEVPGLLLNGWFLDDGNLVGRRDDLIKRQSGSSSKMDQLGASLCPPGTPHQGTRSLSRLYGVATLPLILLIHFTLVSLKSQNQELFSLAPW